MKKQSSRFRLHAGTASILLVFVTLDEVFEDIAFTDAA